MSDVLEGKNVKEAVAKEAAKARALEAANVAKGKAISQLTGQTGSGKRANKKRKAPPSPARTAPTKKRRTAKNSSTAKKAKKRRTVRVADIFG